MHPQPKLAGLSLGRSGAAFDLSQPARENTRVAVGSWLVSTARGIAVVVARGRVHSYEAAVRAGLPRAEQALDKLSVRGIDDLQLAKAEHGHLAWWPSVDGTTLRIVSTAFQTMPSMNLTVTVRDSNGRIVRPSKPRTLPWHESYRFFRLSATTTDLFDAYRNAYLALESILATRTPQRQKAPGQKGEQEGEWFVRALTATGVDLGPFARGAKGLGAAALYEALYTDLRIRVFHAKPGRDTFLPRDGRTMDRVRTGLDTTRRLYLAILEATFGFSRLGGGFSTYAAQAMAAAVFDGLDFVATADESPLDADEPVGHQPDVDGCRLPNLEPAEYVGFTARRRAWARGADLESLPFIRRVVGFLPNHVPAMACRLEGRLEPHGITRLEVEFRLVARNARDLARDLS